MSPSLVQFPAADARPSGPARSDTPGPRQPDAFASALDIAARDEAPRRDLSPTAIPARRAAPDRAKAASEPEQRDARRADAADARPDAPDDASGSTEAPLAAGAVGEPGPGQAAGAAVAADEDRTARDKADPTTEEIPAATAVDPAAAQAADAAAAQAAALLLAAAQALPAQGPAGQAGVGPRTGAESGVGLRTGAESGALALQSADASAVGLPNTATADAAKAGGKAGQLPQGAEPAALAAAGLSHNEDADAEIPATATVPEAKTATAGQAALATATGSEAKTATAGEAAPETRMSASLKALSEALISAGTPGGEAGATDLTAQGPQVDASVLPGLLQAGAPGRGPAEAAPGQAAATGSPAQAAPAAASAPVSALPIEIGMRAMAGSQSFRIRLHPEELGQVDVKLHIDDGGVVSAQVTVDRVETLAMLQRDAKTLERAFEQAGLKTSDSGLQFSLGSDGGQFARQQQQQQPGQPTGAPAPTFAPLAGQDLASAIRSIEAATGGLDIRI